MDVLINKKYPQLDYLARDIGRPYYFNTADQREIFGLGSNMKKDTAWVAHKVVESDTLDYLALKYYNNPTLWWLIAYFNDMGDPFVQLSLHYDILKIPNMSSIEFGEER